MLILVKIKNSSIEEALVVSVRKKEIFLLAGTDRRIYELVSQYWKKIFLLVETHIFASRNYFPH